MPRSYAQVAYDEFWVAALTLNNYTGTQQDDIGSLRQAFINTANFYVGVTGRTELNDAGDRINGSYDFGQSDHYPRMLITMVRLNGHMSLQRYICIKCAT